MTFHFFPARQGFIQMRPESIEPFFIIRPSNDDGKLSFLFLFRYSKDSLQCFSRLGSGRRHPLHFKQIICHLLPMFLRFCWHAFSCTKTFYHFFPFLFFSGTPSSLFKAFSERLHCFLSDIRIQLAGLVP